MLHLPACNMLLPAFTHGQLAQLYGQVTFISSVYKDLIGRFQSLQAVDPLGNLAAGSLPLYGVGKNQGQPAVPWDHWPKMYGIHHATMALE